VTINDSQIADNLLCLNDKEISLVVENENLENEITSNDIDLIITAIPPQTEIDSFVIGSGGSKKPSLQPGKLAKGSIVLMP